MKIVAEQTGLALVSRLLRQSFPSVMLRGQHRLKKELAEPVNDLVYNKNRLAYAPAPCRAPDMDKFHSLLRDWLGAEAHGKDMSAIFLEASQGPGLCIKEYDTTESKRNHRNVDVVYDLITRNHRAKALNPRDIKIVTPYKDQLRLYDMEFDNRAKESGVPKGRLPQPVTLDLFRGREARVIIYDIVVCCGDSKHGLGVVNNDFRACVAATRASDTLIIVGSRELLTVFPEFWDWMNCRIRATDNPLPMTVQYAEHLAKAGLSFNPPTPERDPCEFPLKDEWTKKDDGFRDFEWDRFNTSGERE